MYFFPFAVSLSNEKVKLIPIRYRLCVAYVLYLFSMFNVSISYRSELSWFLSCILLKKKKKSRKVKRGTVCIFQLTVNIWKCKTLFPCPPFLTITFRYVNSELNQKMEDKKFMLLLWWTDNQGEGKVVQTKQISHKLYLWGHKDLRLLLEKLSCKPINIFSFDRKPKPFYAGTSMQCGNWRSNTPSL